MDKRSLLVLAVAAFLCIGVRLASAHCDTLSGPVVADAREALTGKDVTPVLKWVKAADEDVIKAAFKKALAVRGKGPEARDLADTWFFETLVRIHRAGEGAPFTGLKDGAPEPIVAAADSALEKGDATALVAHVTGAVAAGIKERLAKAVEARKKAKESVAAGREYVEAYVQYVHYVERIHLAVTAVAGHGHEAEE